MKAVNVYLTFDGNCEGAFNFYKAVFNGEFDMFSRFNEMPPDPNFQLAEDQADKIMHVSMRIGDNIVIMGSDPGGGSPLTIGNNFSIAIEADSKEEVDGLYAKLSEGGEASMPPAQMFWGAYFGLCRDKFDINWMVSTENN